MMSENIFERDLELIKKFGKEKVGETNFETYLSGEDEYFKIINHMIAVMVPWKKNYHPNQVRESAIFKYRRIKSHLRRLEHQHLPKKGSIFFLPISETTTMLLEPIIKELTKKNEAQILRFDYSLDGLKKELNRRNLPYINFEKYLTKSSLKKAKKIRKKYSDALKIARTILKKSTDYKELEPAIKYYFGARNKFYEILELLEGLKNFIRVEKPSMMIIPDDTMDIARATSYICKKMGIPCLSIQGGNIFSEAPESSETFTIKKIVFGSFAKSIMIKKGTPSKNISITGSPLYDVIFDKKMSNKEIEDERKKLGLSGKTIILFASTTNLDVAKKRLNILFKIVSKNPNLGIIIKQHPGEYLDKKYERTYRALAKTHGVSVIINKGDMWKMLGLSDIYVTEFSTTILEALILKKAIILTNFENFYNYEQYPEKKGIIWHAYNFSDIEEAINDVLQKKPGKKEEIFRDKLIKDSVYKTDGKSAERICKIIEKLKLKN